MYGGGLPLKSLGTLVAEVRWGNQRLVSEFHVVKGRPRPLLGCDTAMKLGAVTFAQQVQWQPQTEGTAWEGHEEGKKYRDVRPWGCEARGRKRRGDESWPRSPQSGEEAGNIRQSVRSSRAEVEDGGCDSPVDEMAGEAERDSEGSVLLQKEEKSEDNGGRVHAGGGTVPGINRVQGPEQYLVEGRDNPVARPRIRGEEREGAHGPGESR